MTPSRPKRPCSHPGCRNLADGRYCPEHEVLHTAKQKQRTRQYDQERGSAHARGYNARWRKASAAWLQENPLCAECARLGRLTVAKLVDHIVPHRGDMVLFWDRTNWQSMCKPCHDAKTAREDGGMGNPRCLH